MELSVLITLEDKHSGFRVVDEFQLMDQDRNHPS
jgi:hypothetical protein